MTDSASGGSEFVGKAMPDRGVAEIVIRASIRIDRIFPVQLSDGKVPTSSTWTRNRTVPTLKTNAGD